MAKIKIRSKVEQREWEDLQTLARESNQSIIAEPAPGLTAHGTSNQVERLFLVPGRGPSKGVVHRLALLNMPQNLRDQQRILNIGNHP